MNTNYITLALIVSIGITSITQNLNALSYKELPMAHAIEVHMDKAQEAENEQAQQENDEDEDEFEGAMNIQIEE